MWLVGGLLGYGNQSIRSFLGVDFGTGTMSQGGYSSRRLLIRLLQASVAQNSIVFFPWNRISFSNFF
jgi:hypothetical protein